MTTPGKLSTRRFKGVVWDVVDGDTIDMLVNLDAFDEWTRRRFRLLGCNAREMHQIGGKEAKANLVRLVPRGTEVGITSVRVDKYALRYDAIITLPDGRDLVTWLVDQEWATRWNGRGPLPLPPWPRGVAA